MNLDTNDLPEEITIDVLPMLTEYGTIVTHDCALDGYVVLGDAVKVTFKIKKKDAINKELVIGLREKASKIRATAESQCVQIEEKIQSLLALPNIEESNK